MMLGGVEWVMMIIGGLLILLFWVSVIILAVYAIRAITRPGGQTRDTNAAQLPVQILQERYARGEISREEYQSMRRDLEI